MRAMIVPLLLALATPAMALAPSGRHDNIVYLNRLKAEREARAQREAAIREAEARSAAAREAATPRTTALSTEASAEPSSRPGPSLADDN